MFTKLSTEPYLTQYSVEVLSSPKWNGGPWIITMENVIDESEAEQLIQLGAIEEYERSSAIGINLNADGSFSSDVSEARTSSNAWCEGVCYTNATALAVINRLSNLTGIVEPNSEYLQLLKYEPGQYYRSHHDYIDHEVRVIHFSMRGQGNQLDILLTPVVEIRHRLGGSKDREY